MKSVKKIIFTFAIIALSIQTSLAEGIIFQDLTLEEGLEKAKKENKRVFIDVYATWCGPCKFLSANVFIDEDLGAFMNEHFVSLKLDGEKGDGLQVMRDYQLSSYPTMLFLNTEKDLLKKIIGVVNPSVIQEAGNEIVFPETTGSFKMKERYEAGERDRAFLAEYVVDMLNSDIDPEQVTETFLKLYPEPNLNDKDEFLVFCIGITDRDHPSMKAFFEDLANLSEIHGDFVLTKLNMSMLGIVNDAVEAKDKSIIGLELNKIYPFYAEFENDEARISQEEIQEMMVEMFEEEME